MATPPVFIQEAETAFNNNTTPKLSAAITSLAGDVLVSLAASESSAPTALPPTLTGETFTQYETSGAAGTNCELDVRGAVIGSGGVAETVSLARTGGTDWFGGNMLLFRGSDGFGAAESTFQVTNGAASRTITTTQPNSALAVIITDWDAADASTRTWLTVNGFTPVGGRTATTTSGSPNLTSVSGTAGWANGDRVYGAGIQDGTTIVSGAGTSTMVMSQNAQASASGVTISNYEQTYFRDGSHYTVYIAYYPDAGAAGLKTVGLSVPSNGRFSIAVVEVKGSASSSTNVTSPAGPGVGDVANPGISAGSLIDEPVVDGSGDVAAPSMSAGSSVSDPVAGGAGDIAPPAVSAFAGWEDIDGATLADYDLTGDDVGSIIRCLVTATNTAGSAEAASNETDQVDEEESATISPPALDGSGDVPAPGVSSGATVSAPAADGSGDVASPSASGGTGWTDIPGATSATYDLAEGDLGLNLRCVVVASNEAGDTEAVSDEVGPVTEESNDAIISSPALDGHGDIQAPAVSGGGWEDIDGATLATYDLQEEDEGKRVRCIVVASNIAGSDEAASDQSDLVEPADESSDASIAVPALDGVGSLPPLGQILSIIIDLDAGATPVVFGGSGDVAAPIVTGGGPTTTSPPPADGAGDVVVPGISSGVSIGVPALDGVGDIRSPVLTSGGKILPRIDLQTRVILANPNPSVRVASPRVRVAVDPQKTKVILDA